MTAALSLVGVSERPAQRRDSFPLGRPVSRRPRKVDVVRGQKPALYVSSYEGAPLAGYDLELGRRMTLLEPHGTVHQPGLNKELAATAVVGTQLAGQTVPFRDSDVRGITGIWYGRVPGLDRARDAIRHANLANNPGVVLDEVDAAVTAVEIIAYAGGATSLVPHVRGRDGRDRRPVRGGLGRPAPQDCGEDTTWPR